MVIKIGINGFGRIGRMVFRKCLENKDLTVAALNDPAISIDYICYLIKFDSTHGKFKEDLKVSDNKIIINGNAVIIYHQKYPSCIPWSQAGVVYVVEASGMFTSYEKASGHLGGQVRRVFVTAPSVDVPMIVLGVNHNKLRYEEKVVSCASSTLYCLAPIVKVLDNNFGISEGFVTSIHAMTPSLKPLDGLCVRGKHWRDHRSIHQNIIPAATGACKALGKILPQVKGKLTGLAFRVPIVDVSVLDISIRLTTDTNLQEILKCIAYEKFLNMKNIIDISTEEVVSSDFIGDRCSCTVDSISSMQLNSRAFKLICWYENEYSYASRVVDTICFSEQQHCNFINEINMFASKLFKINKSFDHINELRITKLNNKLVVLSAPVVSDTKHTDASKSDEIACSSFMAASKNCENDQIKIISKSKHELIKNTEKSLDMISFASSNLVYTKNTIQKVKGEVSNLITITEDILKKSRQSISKCGFFQEKKKDKVFPKLNVNRTTANDSLSKDVVDISNLKNENDNKLLIRHTDINKTCETSSENNENSSLNEFKNDCGTSMEFKQSSEMLISVVNSEEITIKKESKCSTEIIKEYDIICSQDKIQDIKYADASSHNSETFEITKRNKATFVNYVFKQDDTSSFSSEVKNVVQNIDKIIDDGTKEDDDDNNTNEDKGSIVSLDTDVSVPKYKEFVGVSITESLNDEIRGILGKIINNKDNYKPDILDKLESISGTDSENSFQVNEKKSQVLNLMDLSNSLDDLAKLDKICRIIEISDDLSEKLFLPLDEGNNNNLPCWSLKDLCRRINLDDFCNKVFGNKVD